jgi:hypothetical protein
LAELSFVDSKGGYKLFFEKGLDKFSTGATKEGQQSRTLMDSHPSDKNKDVARVGHPESWRVQGKQIPFGIAGKKGKDKCKSKNRRRSWFPMSPKPGDMGHPAFFG